MKKQNTKYHNAPYKENDEYVDALVKRATEKTITRSKEKKGKKRIVKKLKKELHLLQLGKRQR